MSNAPAVRLLDHFRSLEDPRVERTRRHQLLDIVAIALCAVLCGADTWVDIAAFGHAKRDWLGSFLALPNGIPSHDTFGRVFAALDPAQVEAGFRSWVATVAELTAGAMASTCGALMMGSPARTP